jgi:hypothetical protein
MLAKKDRGAKTESLSLRLDPKTRFILEFASRINGQTITTLVERAIRASCDKVRLSSDFGREGPNWQDFWDPDEGVRTLMLLTSSDYPSSFDEDELKVFTEAHKVFFYLPGEGAPTPNRSFVKVLWPKIDEYRGIWRDQLDKDYWAAGNTMVADLSSAKIKPPVWPPNPDPPRSASPRQSVRGDMDDEISF